jgi:hypothetical protein
MNSATVSMGAKAPNHTEESEVVDALLDQSRVDEVVAEIAVVPERIPLTTRPVGDLDIVALIWAIMHMMCGPPKNRLIGVTVMLMSWVKDEMPMDSELIKLATFPSGLLLESALPTPVPGTTLVGACSIVQLTAVLAHKLAGDPIAPVVWSLYRCLNAGPTDTTGLQLLIWFYAQKFNLRIPRVRYHVASTAGRGAGGRGAGPVTVAGGRGAGPVTVAGGRGAGPVTVAGGRGAGPVTTAGGRGGGAPVTTAGGRGGRGGGRGAPNPRPDLAAGL